MRLFNAANMDSPWGFYTSFTTVSDQTGYVDIHIQNPNGSRYLDAEVDRLKVVTWWYEPNLGSGESPADIVMHLYRGQTTSCVNYAISSSDNSYDTKKMVQVTTHEPFNGAVDPGEACWKLRLYPYVTPPNPLDGGQRRRTVYYAYYFEDWDRNDPDGPGSGIW